MKPNARVNQVLRKLKVAAKVAAKVTEVGVHLKNPTPLGIAGLVVTGVSALADQFESKGGSLKAYPLMVSRSQLIEALELSGARMRAARYSDGEHIHGTIAEEYFWMPPGDGICAPPSEAFAEFLRQSLDRILPGVVHVYSHHTSHGQSREARAQALTPHRSEQAEAILAATAPLLEGGRCILLDGKPGVGKTTMAQIISRDACLGRTVLLHGSVFGDPERVGALRASDLQRALAMLTPGVVVVDDVDKIRLRLDMLEAIRATAKLVILTANNGEHDEVLDAALTRAGRVDEVFTIRAANLPRSHPFDVYLTDDEWREISQWPHAYLEEVRRRLIARPGDLRLDDLRSRLQKRTRSGDVLL